MIAVLYPRDLIQKTYSITELSSNKEFTLYQSIYGLNYKCALYSWDIRKYIILDYNFNQFGIT